MMRSFVIALFIMLVSVAVQIITGVGIVPEGVNIADTGILENYTQGKMGDINNSLISSEYTNNGLSLVGGISIFFSSIFSALFVAPLLVSYGVPAWLAILIQAPIWFIYIMDFLNWKGNRQLN